MTDTSGRLGGLTARLPKSLPSGMVTSYLHGVRHHVLVQDLGVDVAQKYDDTAENEQRRWDILALPDDDDEIDLGVAEPTTWTMTIAM